MKMRPAEIIACEPFVQNDIEARLFRIADQYRSAAATGTRPRDLIRQFVDHRRRVKLAGPARGRAQHENADADRRAREDKLKPHGVFPPCCLLPAGSRSINDSTAAEKCPLRSPATMWRAPLTST